jgi:hypothetical protein
VRLHKTLAEFCDVVTSFEGPRYGVAGAPGLVRPRLRHGASGYAEAATSSRWSKKPAQSVSTGPTGSRVMSLTSPKGSRSGKAQKAAGTA